MNISEWAECKDNLCPQEPSLSPAWHSSLGKERQCATWWQADIDRLMTQRFLSCRGKRWHSMTESQEMNLPLLPQWICWHHHWWTYRMPEYSAHSIGLYQGSTSMGLYSKYSIVLLCTLYAKACSLIEWCDRMVKAQLQNMPKENVLVGWSTVL